ncbi:MAG: alpha/beta hydrolase [Gemmatimonadetes bacterium]|nr:alpha/beta hydrolase [Gemmatimonadota bacterium]NNM07412.1 alpha/beta hydrolase [Gemmatimonadota bacterium]
MRSVAWIVAFMLLGNPSGPGQESPLSPYQEQSTTRRPVLLVPGWLGRSMDMMALKERLEREGWDGASVFPFEFDDPVGSSVAHAEELEDAIEAVLRQTGSRELDIIAHSMGGLALWFLLQKRQGALPINRAVFLATPFQGTVTAYLAWGEGGPEMVPDSEFLQERQRAGWPQRWVNSLAIRTPLDLTVVPGYDVSPLGIDDQVICCPTHQGLLDHEETFLLIRDFLLDRREEEVYPGAVGS